MGEAMVIKDVAKNKKQNLEPKFQLAIIMPRINLIGYDTATAQ